MRSEPARLGGISLDFAGIPPRWGENFPYDHAQVGQPFKVGSLISFVLLFRYLLNNIRTFVLHNGFTSPYCKKYLSNNLFPVT